MEVNAMALLVGGIPFMASLIWAADVVGRSYIRPKKRYDSPETIREKISVWYEEGARYDTILFATAPVAPAMFASLMLFLGLSGLL